MAAKRLLIVVDYQKDFVDGVLGFEGAKNLDSGILELVKQYIENGDSVIFTMDTHNDEYMETMEGQKLPVPHCINGTEGWELYGETGKYVKELLGDEELDKVFGDTFFLNDCGDLTLESSRHNIKFIKKRTFGSPALMGLLAVEDDATVLCPEFEALDEYPVIQDITFVGVVTNMCVLSNAVIAKAARPNLNIIVKKDLVDSFDKELHQKALDIMEALHITLE